MCGTNNSLNMKEVHKLKTQGNKYLLSTFFMINIYPQ